MQNCTYCGRVNEGPDGNCRECGALLVPQPCPTACLSMSLWPRSAEQWTRSLAYSLFAGCTLVLFVAIGGSLEGGRVWRDAAPSVGGMLLPMLGALLLPFCIGARVLPKGFRILALIVAALSLSMLFVPALAE